MELTELEIYQIHKEVYIEYQKMLMSNAAFIRNLGGKKMFRDYKKIINDINIVGNVKIYEDKYVSGYLLNEPKTKSFSVIKVSQQCHEDMYYGTIFLKLRKKNIWVGVDYNCN